MPTNTVVKGYNYVKGSEYDASAPIRKAFDVTPAGTDLAIPTRAIMVSADCTVTGILAEDSSPHTTFPLSAGVLYPFCFKRISAVSASATVKGYC